MGTRAYEESLTDNETVEASVAFIDICGFTAISEKENADTVVQMLNHYFDVMVKEIISQNGIVDKFMGDCVMAVFKGEFHLTEPLMPVLPSAIKLMHSRATIVFCLKYPSAYTVGEMISVISVRLHYAGWIIQL